MAKTHQSGFGATIAWLIAWTVITAGVSTWIRHIHQQRIAHFAEIQRGRDAIEVQAMREEFSLAEQALRSVSRTNAARRRAELEKAFGGPVAAAFKNPEFGLRLALQRAAEACAPTNASVRADIDRFTEFTVVFDSSEIISTNQMIAIARRLMPLASPYLDALRFSHHGALVAEIDRQDIEFIEDWMKASDQRIAMLLSRESQSRIAQDPVMIERLRDEQRIGEALAGDPALREKTQNADRNFRQAVQKAYAELTSALEALGKSASLGELRSVRDLDQSEKHLRAAIEHANRSEQFWTNPSNEWQKLLESEGITGDLRETLVKSFPAIFRDDRSKTAKVFEALRGQIESCRYLLRVLTDGADKWKFTSGGGIGFTDDDLARRFERARFQMREDALLTENALRAWSEAIGP